MNISSKNRKILTPINFYIFKRYISDSSNDSEINRSIKKFKMLLDSEEKSYEILNNAFSQYGTNYISVTQSKRKRSRKTTKRMSINYPLFKPNSTDINDKNITKNIFLKKNKTKNIINIKAETKNNKNNTNTNKRYNNFLINTITNKFSRLKEKENENEKDILNFNNKKKNLSKDILYPDNLKIKINNNIKKRNNQLNETEKKFLKTKNILNKTDQCFNNNIQSSKKILNFMEFYNINSNKKESEKGSYPINMNSISYKTMNNIYDINNPYKLLYDIKQIRDINSEIVNKIEKSEMKINLKGKEFNKKCKKSEIKYFGNEELKLLKKIEKKNKEKKKDFRYSLKEIQQKKIFANNYKKPITVSEEIKLRKKKEKNFYNFIDNIMLNNNLFLYDINKIDKRLKLKKENEK